MALVVLDLAKIKAEFEEEVLNSPVDESPELDSIKKVIDEMGLKPIWLQLIRQFGTDMYLKGIQAASRET